MNIIQLLLLVSLGFSDGPVLDLPKPPPPLQGIYITAASMAQAHGIALADALKAKGGTLVVLDIQSGSKLAYPSQTATSIALDNRSDLIRDLTALVDTLHEKDLYVAARFVLFKSAYLAVRKPEWTIKTKGTTRPFFNRDGAIWLDPTNPELLAYYGEVVDELIDAGFDEVQFDYVRFPEAGKGGYIGYSYVADQTLTRDQAITQAVKNLAERLHRRGVYASVDLFGIIVWDNISWKLIGQNVGELANYVDAMYPMPYPSHFGPGWGGHKNPADEPYFFVQETTKKFLEQTADRPVKIRPWLQGFAMNVTNYGPQYVREQIRALKDIGIEEFAIWNASNNYSVGLAGFSALP